MPQNDVLIAFDIVLIEIEKAIDELNLEGSQAFAGGKYEIARDLMEKGSRMTTFREHVKDLQKEWLNIFAAVVPNTKRKRKTPSYRKSQYELRTSKGEFRVPILQSLVELGGSAPANNVLDHVEKIMGNRLNAYDRQTLPSDPRILRWKNNAHWARFAMVKEGLLSPNSPRGIWEITESGRKYLKQHG